MWIGVPKVSCSPGPLNPRNCFFFLVFFLNLGFKMQKTRRKLCLWRTVSFSDTWARSVQLILLSERLARKPNFRLSLFAKQLPSQARGQNRLLLITKKYYPLAGGFATTWVSKANRYGVFGSLVPCTAAIPNPGPQILLQQIREEWRQGGGGFVICMPQHYNSYFSFTFRLQKWRGSSVKSGSSLSFTCGRFRMKPVTRTWD